jgi:hypothetical protein
MLLLHRLSRDKPEAAVSMPVRRRPRWPARPLSCRGSILEAKRIMRLLIPAVLMRIGLSHSVDAASVPPDPLVTVSHAWQVHTRMD